MKSIAKGILLGLLAFGGVALAAVFSTFGPANGILVGTTTSAQTTAATSADVRSLWSGTCNSGTFLRGDGTCVAVSTGTGTTYSPTLTCLANCTSPTAAQGCQYISVGTVVSVSCSITYSQTANGATTRIGVTLPIASNLTSNQQLAGSSADPDSASSAAFGVDGDATNDRAELRGIAVGTGTKAQMMVFMYRVQ